MENKPTQDIEVLSEIEIERKADFLNAKNMLQIAFALYLGFDDSNFDDFVTIYGKAIGKIVEDSPDIVEKYDLLLKEDKQNQFDFAQFKDVLRAYIPPEVRH